MSRSPQKTPENLYKTLILTNFSIQFTHLHYIAVSQIGFEPHSKSLRDYGEPFQMSRSGWRTQAIGFEPHSNRKRLESGFGCTLCPSQTEKPPDWVAFAVRFI